MRVRAELDPDADSFFVPEWVALGEEESEVHMQSPTKDVPVLVDRVKKLLMFLRTKLQGTSGVYIGKTNHKSLSKRFETHRREKTALMDSPIVMVVLQRFSTESVPAELARWGLSVEMFALLYESLLTKACEREGIPLFFGADTVVAGGGMLGQNEEALVYALVAVTNEPRIPHV